MASDFRAQVKAVMEKGYDAITLQGELAALIRRTEPQRPTRRVEPEAPAPAAEGAAAGSSADPAPE